MKNRKLNTVSFVFLICIGWGLHAQDNVGVGTTNPDPSAKLEVSAIDKGFLMPRMTEAMRNAIINPATGLMVYQTDAEDGTWYYDGAQWRNLSDNLGNHLATQVLDMDTNAIVNVPTPVNGLDAVNKDYVDAAIAGGGGGGGNCVGCITPTQISMESMMMPNIGGAMTYCDTLTEGGFSDWRIPFMDELVYCRMGNGITFPDALSVNWMWTRSENPNSLTSWRIMRLDNMEISGTSGATSIHRVRCVRAN